MRRLTACLVVGALAAPAGLPACSSGSSVQTLKQGDCLNVTEGDITPSADQRLVTRLPVVPCTQAHTHEVYATTDLSKPDPGAPASTFPTFPGTQALDALAQVECVKTFQSEVGVNPFDTSTLAFTWMVPTLASWNDTTAPDRTIVCLLRLADGQPGPLTASMLGSRGVLPTTTLVATGLTTTARPTTTGPTTGPTTTGKP